MGVSQGESWITVRPSTHAESVSTTMGGQQRGLHTLMGRHPCLQRGLPSPGVGQWVQMRQDAYSVVLGLVEQEGAPAAVRVADFAGYRDAPFYGRTLLERHELLWDPRGWWYHTLALAEAGLQHRSGQQGRSGGGCRLFRPSTALSPSGLPYNASAPNLALPHRPATSSSSGGVAASRLEVFMCENAWDPTFVLAPAPLVDLQNQEARQDRDLWTPVGPSSLLDAASTLPSGTTGHPTATLASSTAAGGGHAGSLPGDGRVSLPTTTISRTDEDGGRPGGARSPFARHWATPQPPAPPAPPSTFAALMGSSSIGVQTRLSGMLMGGGSLEEGGEEEAWQELQRQMGSFRRVNRYGAKSGEAMDMEALRELLRLRRAVSEGVFQLTAVGLEQQQQHRPAPQQEQQQQAAAAAGGGEDEGLAEGNNSLGGSSQSEDSSVTYQEGRAHRGGEEEGSSKDDDLSGWVSRGGHQQHDQDEEEVWGRARPATVQGGRPIGGSWFAMQGSNRLVLTSPVTLMLPAARATAAGELAWGSGSYGAEETTGRRPRRRRKVRLALLASTPGPREAELGSIMRPLDPAHRPLASRAVASSAARTGEGSSRILDGATKRRGQAGAAWADDVALCGAAGRARALVEGTRLGSPVRPGRRTSSSSSSPSKARAGQAAEQGGEAQEAEKPVEEEPADGSQQPGRPEAGPMTERSLTSRQLVKNYKAALDSAGSHGSSQRAGRAQAGDATESRGDVSVSSSSGSDSQTTASVLRQGLSGSRAPMAGPGERRGASRRRTGPPPSSASSAASSKGSAASSSAAGKLDTVPRRPGVQARHPVLRGSRE